MGTGPSKRSCPRGSQLEGSGSDSTIVIENRQRRPLFHPPQGHSASPRLSGTCPAFRASRCREPFHTSHRPATTHQPHRQRSRTTCARQARNAPACRDTAPLPVGRRRPTSGQSSLVHHRTGWARAAWPSGPPRQGLVRIRRSADLGQFGDPPAWSCLKSRCRSSGSRKGAMRGHTHAFGKTVSTGARSVVEAGPVSCVCASRLGLQSGKTVAEREPQSSSIFEKQVSGQWRWVSSPGRFGQWQPILSKVSPFHL